jgi:hypothetical protein
LVQLCKLFFEEFGQRQGGMPDLWYVLIYFEYRNILHGMFSYIAAGIMIKKNACSQKVNSKELD